MMPSGAVAVSGIVGVKVLQLLVTGEQAPRDNAGEYDPGYGNDGRSDGTVELHDFPLVVFPGVQGWLWSSGWCSLAGSQSAAAVHVWLA